MEHNPFDIIKVLSDDSLAWVEAAERIECSQASGLGLARPFSWRIHRL